MNRMLPNQIEFGIPFRLVPCIKCGTPFKGVLRDDLTVEDLSHVPDGLPS